MAACRRGCQTSIDALIARMTAQLDELRQARDGRAAFHATYLRTTRAVADALRAGAFLDANWVERWDVAFAGLYLDALDADRRGDPVPRPWAVAFAAAAGPRSLPALQHVLLGMNAHINYDLPQALLAVISDDELRELGERSWQDTVLQPLNRAATRRFLRESRTKVWLNAATLSRSRREGQPAYAVRLAQLEELSAARVADLVRPGPVLLRLATRGFGVLLDHAAGQARATRGLRLPRRAPAGPAAARPEAAGGAAARLAAARAAAARLTGGRLAAVRQPGSRQDSPLRSFDPVLVGRLECALWMAY